LVTEFTATPKGLVPAGTVATVTWPTADDNITARLNARKNSWKLRVFRMGFPSQKIVTGSDSSLLK
jgi:hypothetical protein